MNWYKQATKDPNAAFESMFDSGLPTLEERSPVVRVDPPATRPYPMTLYRGFDADIENLERNGNSYILSPEKCEQGVLWFSRDESDAKGRGAWVLKYEIEAAKHYQRNHKEDGSFFDVTPEEISVASSPSENSKIYGGIELPDGFLWSYKAQKYIIANKPIVIDKGMISKDTEGENNELV
jgi:hypothetical protein